MDDVAISLLKDLIQIKSDNAHEEKVALYLKAFLEQHGIASSLVNFAPGRSSLVAEISNGPGKVFGVTGHLDVVSAGDETQWQHPPYSGHIEDGLIWGRGTSDMKAGLAGLVLAMIRLKESQNFKGTIRLLATVGEEVGEHGSKQLTELGYTDDLDALLIAEPCNIAIMYAHKGSLNYKVTAKGLAAHSSTPELGRNAIHQLNLAALRIQESINSETQKWRNPVLGQTFHNITLISGGIQVNSIPDQASFEANARTIPEYDNTAVIKTIETVLRELNQEQACELSVEVTADQPPVESQAQSHLIQIIQEVASRREKLSPRYLINQMKGILDAGGEGLNPNDFETILAVNRLVPIAGSGTTDAAQFLKFKKDIELAVYGPGIPMLNHKRNERLPIEQYLEFIDAFESIMETYLREEKTDAD